MILNFCLLLFRFVIIMLVKILRFIGFFVVGCRFWNLVRMVLVMRFVVICFSWVDGGGFKYVGCSFVFDWLNV